MGFYSLRLFLFFYYSHWTCFSFSFFFNLFALDMFLRLTFMYLGSNLRWSASMEIIEQRHITVQVYPKKKHSPYSICHGNNNDKATSKVANQLYQLRLVGFIWGRDVTWGGGVLLIEKIKIKIVFRLRRICLCWGLGNPLWLTGSTADVGYQSSPLHSTCPTTKFHFNFEGRLTNWQFAYRSTVQRYRQRLSRC